MSCTASQLLERAKQDVGNNGSKYWSRYSSDPYVNGDETPYCAYFVSYWLDEFEVDCPWFPNGFAPDSYDLPDQWIGKYDLEPGDTISFDWDDPPDYRGDHTGFVISKHDWGYLTLEGNTSGGIVDIKQRVFSVVLGGLRPKYKKETEKGIWIPDGDRWWYQNPDGTTYPEDQWLKIDGQWYYFGENGWLQSGWIKYRPKNETEDKWYYCHEEHDGHFGEMHANEVLKWQDHYYILGKDGAMKTGDMTNPEHDGTYGCILF